MAKGGSGTQTQKVEQTTSLPAYAQPYYQQGMAQAQGLLAQPYTPYEGQRIADFTEQQKGIQQEVAGLKTPETFGQATGLAGLAAARALQPVSIQGVEAPKVEAALMQAAQTDYRPNLTTFMMETPETFGQAQAQQYMSPYTQNVLDIQRREAIRDAQRGQLVQDLGAARQGTYGGSRQLLAGIERERNLGTQLGDIEAKGLQSAYENAQMQFERDRAARMDALKQNLASQISTQQLQTTTDMQVAFKNLDAEQQARVANQAAENQARGMNAENALRSALANQQADVQAQQISMQGIGLAGQAAQTMTNAAQAAQNADLARLSAQQSAAAQEQAMQQQYLDTAYQDFLRQQNYPAQQLAQYMNMLSGVPVTPSTSTTTTAPSPSLASQLMGAGLGAAGLYNMYKGG